MFSTLLPDVENALPIFVAIDGNTAIVPTTKIAMMRAYSMRSCPLSSRSARSRSLRLLIARNLPPLENGRRCDAPPPRGNALREQAVERREIGRDLRPDRLNRADAADGDDPDQQTVFNEVLARVFTHKTSNQCLHFSYLLV